MRGANMKITPIGDRVLVKQDESEQKTEGGIFLPDTAKETPQWGRVVCVGAGKVEDGKLRPLTVKEGDRIIYGKYSGTKVKMGTEELLFMHEGDIIAIIEE